MNEWWMIASMTIGGAMFAIGGTGPKYVRRFILPVCLGLIALFNGFIWWRCAGYVATQIGTFCLPYGSKTPYWLKAIVFTSFVLPSFFLGFTWWQLITPSVCFGVFCLSNTKWAGNTFVWKICEFIIGASIGIAFAKLISQTFN